MPDPWYTGNHPEHATGGPESTAVWVFDNLLQRKWMDSVVLLDDSGRPCYPQLPESQETSFPDSPAWQQARSLELEQGRFREAIGAYAAIVVDAEKDASKPDEWAQARLGMARCLAREARPAGESTC